MIRTVVLLVSMALATSGCASIRNSPAGEAVGGYFSPRSETGESAQDYWVNRIVVGTLVLSFVFVLFYRPSRFAVRSEATPGELPRCRYDQDPYRDACR